MSRIVALRTFKETSRSKYSEEPSLSLKSKILYLSQVWFSQYLFGMPSVEPDSTTPWYLQMGEVENRYDRRKREGPAAR